MVISLWMILFTLGYSRQAQALRPTQRMFVTRRQYPGQYTSAINDEYKRARIAVLIDGENAGPSLINQYLEEAGRFGKVTVKRVYADWTSPHMGNWKDQLNICAIRPIQKFAYTKDKGSTDTALIIDALDLLHSECVDGFCVVSSDSDYTGLAHRIREEGLLILGIGRSHTPLAFVHACEHFTYAETLIPNQNPSDVPSTPMIQEPISGALNSQTQSSFDTSVSISVPTMMSTTITSSELRPIQLSRSVFVRNISILVTEATLRSIFCGIGSIQQVRFGSHHGKGRARYAFIDFINPSNAETALGLSGTTICDHAIEVELAVTPIPMRVDFAIIERAFDVVVSTDTNQAALTQLEKAIRFQVPSFDYRTYGMSSFRTFCESLKPSFAVVVASDNKTMNLCDLKNKRRQIAAPKPVNYTQVKQAFEIVDQTGTNRAMLSQLAEAIRRQDPSFNYRSYGKSSFRQFCESLKPEFYVEVESDKCTFYLRRLSGNNMRQGETKF